MTDSSKPHDPGDDPSTIALGIAVVAAVLVLSFVAVAAVRVSIKFMHWQIMLKEQFAALIGLPVAAIASFVLVIFLRHTVGPINVKVPGFEFDGAAGQGIMWIFFFLSMAYAIHLVWAVG
jgi:hypothetical protein